MICEVCQRPFVPKKGETKCLTCEIAEWQKKQPNVITVADSEIYRFDGNTIWLVIWQNKKEQVFMKLPPPPKKRSQIEYVFTDAPNENVYEAKILTNYIKGTSEIKDYWFKKLPDFADPMTGTDYILIPARTIRAIENDNFLLEDGYVRVVFG